MAEESVYGWVLLPVAVERGHEKDPKTYEFEGEHAYFEYLNGAWGFIDANEAPTVSDALEKMETFL